MNLTEPEELTKDSYDKHGHAWAQKYRNDDFYASEMEEFNKLLPKGKILEIGSGAGKDAKKLLKLGYEYIGTDISDTLLDIARKEVPGQEFINQSVYQLSFPYKFDGFWAAAVLLHVPKSRINEALESIKSVLKPDAIGFIAIKDGEGEEVEEYEIDGHVLERFYAYWSKNDFAKILKKNNFEVLQYSYRPIMTRQRWHCYIVKNID